MDDNSTVTNSIGMVFVRLPKGSFLMGGDPVAEQADENETPRHTVRFEKPFAVGQTVVTQDQWEKVMESNPSRFIGPDHPVETVSHAEAVRFIERLNEREGAGIYALPTEAQWEYAARAGSAAAYCFGSERSRLGEFAWYRKNSGNTTHPVGQLAPNDWGLFDMNGNVHEWCANWFDRNYYAESPAKNPKGPGSGLARALRGGDWGSEDWYCRSAIRSLSAPDRKSPRVGFRLVMRIEGE